MQLSTARNVVIEIGFTSTASHGDPYNEVELDVLFKTPEGETLRVPAFWAGGQAWRVRFAGPTVGEYAYESVCSDAADAGLHGQRGTVTVREAPAEHPLYAHGRLRVASDRRHFEHADGTPFFWMGDTWWMGLSTRLDWPRGFKALAADRVKKGFSVVQIIAGPYPDMSAWDKRGRNHAGFPFEEDFVRINPAYYDEADLKIAHLVHAGLTPCIVGMWGYYLPLIGVEKIKRFWRNLIARYGAYPVVWCAAGEGTMPYYLSKSPEGDAEMQKQGWTEVMRYIREIDAYHNLLTVHPSGFGRDVVEDPTVMDFEMLQTGHGDLASVGPTIDMVKKAVVREPIMPVINSEVNYEGILGYAWQNIQRLCFWHSVLHGTAGHTYGANGIWQMCTDEEPYGASPHGRCWGNTPWDVAMHLPGSGQLAGAARFLRRYAWWEWERHPEWTVESPHENDPNSNLALGVPGRARLIYCAPPCWNPPQVKGLEDGVQYHALYFDPVRGEEHGLGPVTRDAQGNWSPPIPPECHDWILVLEA